jgi:DNA-binding CsgD family transcriptional regulator
VLAATEVYVGVTAERADHHIQHVYDKIGVSSRGAAALWAMQNGVLG